jgi:hypothetical protein
MKQNYLKENTTGTDQYDEINSILCKQSSYQGNSSTKARAGRVTSCIGQSRAVASCSVLLLHDASSSARSAARRSRALGGSAMLIKQATYFTNGTRKREILYRQLFITLRFPVLKACENKRYHSAVRRRRALFHDAYSLGTEFKSLAGDSSLTYLQRVVGFQWKWNISTF